MSDLISRQAAIDIAKGLLIPFEEYAQNNQAIGNYCAELIRLPSAETHTLTKEQWKQALDELFDVPLFNGRYDAKHGSQRYMEGIGTVLEWMAYKAEDDSVYDAFLTNMEISESEANEP